jgi:hypothetical protein
MMGDQKNTEARLPGIEIHEVIEDIFSPETGIG